MPLHYVRGHTSFSTKERERAKAGAKRSEAKRRTIKFESLRVRQFMPFTKRRGMIAFPLDELNDGFWIGSNGLFKIAFVPIINGDNGAFALVQNHIVNGVLDAIAAVFQ